jgi:hypothetical protein
MELFKITVEDLDLNYTNNRSDEADKVNETGFKKLDNLLKESQLLREQTPAIFYEFVYKLVERSLNSLEIEEESLRRLALAMSLLKNSAAACKPELSECENSIIHILLQYLREASLADGKKAAFHLDLLKYFSNLIQGNPKALQTHSDQLLSICFSHFVSLATNHDRVN